MKKHGQMEKIDADLRGAGLRIGIVLSRFNPEIGGGLLSSCTAALIKHGVSAAETSVVTVPGALEVPLTLQKMAQSGHYDALIALGAVIRGETYHFEIVSNESCSGITAVQLDTGVPIANGILTTENDEQALARMAEKGADCALTAIEMANLLRRIGNEK
jgi:6,7-dimethyl-8-ribityllumazine synthase